LKSKVLVADDSPLVQRMVEKMLTSAGYDVVTANDGQEAVEKARGGVHLVILDLQMPRMGGHEACRLLKADPATRALPVIILTSSEDRDGASRESGADHYITKDTNTHRILDLVKSVLGEAAPP
jgi:CheY-like chemotaxis protein